MSKKKYYNPGKEKEALIMFDDMIPDMISYRRLLSVIIELFNRGWN